jgi:hypothetical protein
VSNSLEISLIPGHASAGLEGEWIFKPSLVELTGKLVASAKSSDELMELIIPLVRESLTTPAKEHFEEDGLIL